MNSATRTTAAVWGVILGISGMSHGLFEALQGNNPTNSLMINAIGEQHRMWEHGAEPALTIIPNFLYSGLASMVVGLALITWSLWYLQRPRGHIGFLLIWIALVLVGGGIAQVILFPVVFAVATRIHGDLSWWRHVLSERLRGLLAAIWPATLGLSSFLLLLALVIATFGYFPGLNDPDLLLSIMGLSLVVSFVLYIISGIAAFARDMVQQRVVPILNTRAG